MDLLWSIDKNKFLLQMMDSNSSQLCRLCLESSDDVVNIFDKLQDSTIASILTQHFWFQVARIANFVFVYIEYTNDSCLLHSAGL